MAPHNIYRCSGDDELVAIAVTDDQQWLALCKALGEPAWATDDDLVTAAGRLAAEPTLSKHLAEWCATRSPEEVTDALWPRGVPAAPVVLPHAVIDLPQITARGFYEPVDHPLLGRLRLPGFPARFASRDEPFHARPAPLLGQDNGEVLRGLLGLSGDELATLADRHIIGEEPLAVP